MPDGSGGDSTTWSRLWLHRCRRWRRVTFLLKYITSSWSEKSIFTNTETTRNVMVYLKIARLSVSIYLTVGNQIIIRSYKYKQRRSLEGVYTVNLLSASSVHPIYKKTIGMSAMSGMSVGKIAYNKVSLRRKSADTRMYRHVFIPL